jgi:hypothetical protein
MADVTFALSENALKRVFRKKVDTFPVDKSGDKTFAWGRIAYRIRFHLANGDIELKMNAETTEGRKDVVRVKELDIIWDELFFQLDINISEQCVGGGCIDLPWPLPDLCFPEKCIFQGNPDITLPLNLPSNGIRSEVSGNFIPNTRRVGSPPPPHEFPLWQIRLHPIRPFDVDVFDVADMAGDLFHRIFKKLIDDVLSPIPDWAKDLLWQIIGDPIEWILREVLDIGDDVQEWLQNIIGKELGIVNFIAGVVVSKLDDFVIHEMDDPFKIIDAEKRKPEDTEVLNPEVRIGISDFGVVVTEDELVVNVGIKPA